MTDHLWKLPTPRAVDASAVFTALRVQDAVFRFPAGVPSGGELQVVRLKSGLPVGTPVTIALEPGEPDALAAALLAFCESVLKARGVLAADAQLVTVEPAPPPVVVEPPLGTML